MAEHSGNPLPFRWMIYGANPCSSETPLLSTVHLESTRISPFQYLHVA